MDLGRDAFTVTYDPDRVEVEAIMRCIRRLGYKSEEAPHATPEPLVASVDRGDLPAPVGAAVARARTTKAVTLIEFFAEWCGPCKVLERTILGSSQVREVLERFERVKVDTDQYVEPSDYFKVVGLPTLVVLDSAGAEIYRREGMIEADELARVLSQLLASQP